MIYQGPAGRSDSYSASTGAGDRGGLGEAQAANMHADSEPTTDQIQPLRPKVPAVIACVVVLLASFGLMLTSIRVKSATVDEDAYIGKGTAIWMAGNYGLGTSHPPLGAMINSLPLLLEPELEPPRDHRCWPDGTARSCGREMLFHRSDTRRVLFLARLPTIFLTLITASLVYRWSGELFGSRAAVVSLALCALDPNMLANGRLVTPDIVTTFVIFVNAYLFWRFSLQPSWKRLLPMGVALGVAGSTHFATGLLGPLIVVGSACRVWQPIETSKIDGLRRNSRLGRWITAMGLLLTVGVIAAVVIWAIHSFDIGPVPLWQNVHLPAPAYFNELVSRLQDKSAAPHSFLLGRHYSGGWWPFFLVAFLVKTPLATILIIGFAVADLIRRRDGRLGDAVLITVAGVYFVAASLSDFNRGYRYILPVVPFLFVLAGRATRLLRGQRDSRLSHWLQRALSVLVIWLVVAIITIHPDYLAYFNELVGPANGYQVLVDSSLDWGQDLPALARYVTEEGLSSVYLSWFGEARPSQYGIPHRFIPSKPDELSDVHTRVYHPDYPPPGTYAISATNLQGLLFDDHDVFEFFLKREPVAQPGYSIMVYEVSHLLDPEAERVRVNLGSTQIDRVPTSVFEDVWKTNDLELRWFDAPGSCIQPIDGEAWYVLEDDIEAQNLPCPLWEHADLMSRVPERKGEGMLLLYRLSRSQDEQETWLRDVQTASPLIISNEIAFAPGEAPELRREVAPSIGFGDRLACLGYSVSSDVLEEGGTWDIIIHWQALSDGGDPVKAFVQLLDDNGNPRTQYDGFGIPSIGWRQGDLMAQRYTLDIPADLEAGRYWVQFGVYHARTRERFPALREGKHIGSRLLLPPLRVE